jgi:hypothetical protein
VATVRLVPVAVDCGAFEARIIAARLGAEGIVWTLRGADGVYPVGGTDVLVFEQDVDRARELLALATAGDDERGDHGFEDDNGSAALAGGSPLHRRRAVAALALAALVVVARSPWW